MFGAAEKEKGAPVCRCRRGPGPRSSAVGSSARTSETTGDQIEAAKAARARQDEADREAGLKAAAAKAPQMKVATDSGKRQLSSNPDAVRWADCILRGRGAEVALRSCTGEG